MKPALIALLALVVAAGCGKKEPELRSDKVITPDEAANELFVEAVELVSKARAEEATDIPTAIKRYEQALSKVRKIVSDYKKSDIAVKLVSDEALLKGKSMAQIEKRVNELKAEEREDGIRINLPEAEPIQVPKFIVINVKENGQLTMAGKSLKMAKLEATLRRERKDHPTAKVQIRSHGEAAFKHAVVVLIKCRDAGFLKATIAYDSIE